MITHKKYLLILISALHINTTAHAMEPANNGWFGWINSISPAAAEVRGLIADIRELKAEIERESAVPTDGPSALDRLQELLAQIQTTTPQLRELLAEINQLLTPTPGAPTTAETLGQVNATLDKINAALASTATLQKNCTAIAPRLGICGLGFSISFYALYHLHKAINAFLDTEEDDEEEHQSEEIQKKKKARTTKTKKRIKYACAGFIGGIVLMISSHSALR